MNAMMGRLGAWWGVVGVTLLIGWAVVRLTPIALEGWAMPWGWLEWVVALPWLAFMLVGEGYRGFQKGFAPRVAARARYLREHPQWLHVLLAPAFCMGFFHATRKRMIVSWAVTSGIVLLILAVRLLPQPWRGIVDLGVVAGLTWGLVAIVLYAVHALTAHTFDHPAETPEKRGSADEEAA